MHNIIHPL